MTTQRGQKSKDALAAAEILRENMRDKLPAAPDYMDKEHREEWDAVVNCFDPSKLTRAMYAILEAYIQHSIQARQLAKLIEEVDEFEQTAAYLKLLRALTSETKHIASLGVRLGIAVHTGGNKNDIAKQDGGSPAPWES